MDALQPDYAITQGRDGVIMYTRVYPRSRIMMSSLPSFGRWTGRIFSLQKQPFLILSVTRITPMHGNSTPCKPPPVSFSKGPDLQRVANFNTSSWSIGWKLFNASTFRDLGSHVRLGRLSKEDSIYRFVLVNRTQRINENTKKGGRLKGHWWKRE